MIKAVVDTNVLISGLIWEGTPKKIIDKFRFDNLYSLILSPELIHEFRTKLLKKFRLEQKLVNQWVQEITESAQLVIPHYVTKICRDPNDNMILDTASGGQADFIISGDKDLLSMVIFKKIPIITPRKFLEIMMEIKGAH